MLVDVFVNVGRLESDLRQLEHTASLETTPEDALAYTQFGCASNLLLRMFAGHVVCCCDAYLPYCATDTSSCARRSNAT